LIFPNILTPEFMYWPSTAAICGFTAIKGAHLNGIRAFLFEYARGKLFETIAKDFQRLLANFLAEWTNATYSLCRTEPTEGVSEWPKSSISLAVR
jgi:hypothetical protein